MNASGSRTRGQNASVSTPLLERASPSLVPPSLSIKRRMSGRDTHEAHRVSSPLELLFDLTTVVAVAAAAARLRHDIANEFYMRAMVDLLFSFFTVWWSWMNFTWFSSAYDTDDIGYRLASMAQMVGVLIMAAGLAQDGTDPQTGTLGFTIMRAALVGLWLRAAREHPERRTTCCRYAMGLTVLQGLWLLRIMVLPDALMLASFALLVALELAMPPLAERSGETPWHPHHITERYSLFTIILLGECMAGTANAMSGVLKTHGWSLDLMVVSCSLVGLIGGLWWAYFLVPFSQVLHLRRERALLWGYGHAVVFMALAALDGVIGVIADVLQLGFSHVFGIGHKGPSPLLAITLAAIAVVIFLAALWWLGGRTTRRAERSPLLLLPSALFAGTAVAVVACGSSLPWGLPFLTFMPCVLVALVMRQRHLQPERFAVR